MYVLRFQLGIAHQSVPVGLYGMCPRFPPLLLADPLLPIVVSSISTEMLLKKKLHLIRGFNILLHCLELRVFGYFWDPLNT